MSGLKIKRWDQWDVPPMWVWVVSGLALILISTVVSWKIGESISAGARIRATPPPPPAVRGNVNDPDSF